MSKGKKNNLLKIVLWWQGLYYGGTAVWAMVDLGHFSRVSRHFGSSYEMHSISALALVLSLAFIYGAVRERHRAFAGWLLLGSALAVIGPELAYFSLIKDTLFVADLVEETVVAMAALLALVRR